MYTIASSTDVSINVSNHVQYSLEYPLTVNMVKSIKHSTHELDTVFDFKSLNNILIVIIQ